MAPTVPAVGAVFTGSTSITPPFPAGIVSGDILLTVCESAGGQNYTVPAGWAQVSTDGTPVSPVVQGVNTQLTVLWRRYDGTGTAPTLTGVTDHALGRMLAVRGCPASGNPWNVVSVATEATADTSAAWPTVTTTIADTLVLLIMASSADIGTAQISAITGTHSLTGLTEHIDNAITTGNGGVIIAYSGVMAAAGNIGNPTATLTTAGFKSFMTLAMASAAVPGIDLVRRISPGRRRRNHPNLRR